jgi:hypothetical protein
MVELGGCYIDQRRDILRHLEPFSHVYATFRAIQSWVLAPFSHVERPHLRIGKRPYRTHNIN